MPRYDVIEGSYTGTSDDVAGRWYIVDTEGDAVDKRGRGYATREDALDALVARLSMYPDPADLVGATDLAQRAGKQVATVHSWRARHADFPEPVVQLAAGPVWDWRAVEQWLAKPRPAGRPKR